MRIEAAPLYVAFPFDVPALVDESSVNNGLEALRRYIRENVEDPWLLMDRITLTIGR